jgi:hypothetical protein
MGLGPREREQLEVLTRASRIPARELRAASAPLPRDDLLLVQRGAREHPDARVRRECLGVLDHRANDESTSVFRAAALCDPVPHVRVIALHGLACERCRVHALEVEDTVTDLLHVLGGDGNDKVRHGAVLVLARFVTRDGRVRDALRAATRDDPDPLVREVAAAAVEGRRRDIKSRKALRRRTRGRRRAARTPTS